MNKSYGKDIQLLMKILQNQDKIKNVLRDFNCNEKNLDQSQYGFDLCAMYMSQIGVASKYLTDDTKQSFKNFDPSITGYFRNMIDHVYEKVNKAVLKAYVFNMVKPDVIKEVKDRIIFCSEHAKEE